MIAAGYLYDRAFRKDPERVVRQAGLFIVLFGVVLVIGLRFELDRPAHHLLSPWPGPAPVPPSSPSARSSASVSPYRLRAQAFAIVPVFTSSWAASSAASSPAPCPTPTAQRTALDDRRAALGH